MFRLAVLSAVLAVACAAPAPGLVSTGLIGSPLLTPSLPATLLPRVAIAPAQTTIVRQPIIVDQPTPVLRSVPVPVRAVSYAAPSIIAASPYISSPYISSGLVGPQLIGSPLGAPLLRSSVIGSPLIGSQLIGSPLIGSPLGAPLLLK